MAELLVELLSEEIPARMQARAAEDLKRLVCAGLKEAGLSFGTAEAFATPRRLALFVDDLPARQPDVREERRGPRVDAPEKAVEGFLRSANLTRDEVEKRETPKGAFYFAVIEKTGRAAREVLADLLPDVVAQVPWPKSMRWEGTNFRWVRPLHSIVAVFDGRVVAGASGPGISFTNRTRGHPVLAPKPFKVKSFADYRAKLEKNKVILDAAERRQRIRRQAEKLAGQAKLTLRPDDALLEENAGLTEWPVVLMGAIDEAFMDLPPEVLSTAMRTHQRYFTLVGRDGRPAPRFILVADNEAQDGGRAIVAGNERVLRARLADAKFFWDQDRKRTLADRVPDLAGRIFHARLGSMAEKAERIARLARALAPYANADGGLAERAARLCKADLNTEMVGEFPELQGTMGRYYALNDGEGPEVADAIAEHYAPVGPNDACPVEPVSVAVALADKIDSLVGFFAIGERPTGSKDPFALRRTALGVIRLVIDNGLRIPLTDAFAESRRLYDAGEGAPQDAFDASALLSFFADRLKVHLREKGVRHDLIAAVFALGGEDDLVRLLARVGALGEFLETDDGANLLTAYRRASNIVRIEEQKDHARYDGGADEALLSEKEERALFAGLAEAQAKSAAALADEKFALAMAALAGLRGPVDAFFDHVTVNCGEPELRINRLRLLSQIRSTLGGIADFSKIEGGER